MEEKELNNLTENKFIKQYRKTEKDKYEKPSVTTDMVIFTVTKGDKPNVRKKAEQELKTLLIKRGGHPYKGAWALAGGFMGIDEDLDTAVQRELYEETGVRNVYAEQLYTWSAVDRDPRMRILSASYLALVAYDELPPLVAGEDAEEAEWFTVKDKVLDTKVETQGKEIIRTQQIQLILTAKEEISAVIEKVTRTRGTNTKVTTTIKETNGIAFDHAEIILYSLERLRGKVDYTNIAFNLVGERFTLPDLQEVYEVILNKKLQKVRFRRHVGDMVKDTGEERTGGAYRPSKLYRYNVEWEYGAFN